MAFESIQGQDAVLRRLQIALQRDRLPSGVIFYGIEGVGKRTTAFELARALNCDRGAPENCACLSCVKARHGSHPDVQYLEPVGQFLKVEQIEPLVEHALLRPFEGRRRIYIIDQAERIREDTASRLLKTLEEPPLFTHFVLLTAVLSSVLPTIRSRCWAYHFAELSPERIASILTGSHGLTADEARRRAAFAGGSLARALVLDESDCALHDETAAWMEVALGRSDATPGELAAKLLREGARTKVDLDDLLRRLDRMIEFSHEVMTGRRPAPPRLPEFQQQYNFFQRLIRARALVAGNVTPALVLEETVLNPDEVPTRKWTETFVQTLSWV